jgi:hypothetical protein
MYKRGLIILNWICISVFCICIFQSISIKKRIQIQNQEIEQLKNEGAKEHEKHQKRMKILYDEKEKWMKENKGKNTDIFFEEIINALIEVESGGNPKAVGDNGKAIGILQIHPVVIEDVNNILCQKKYKLEDRWCPVKSREIAKIYLQHYTNENWSADKIAQIWNGGPNGWKKESTKPYKEKFIMAYENTKES